MGAGIARATLQSLTKLLPTHAGEKHHLHERSAADVRVFVVFVGIFFMLKVILQMRGRHLKVITHKIAQKVPGVLSAS